MKMALQFTAGVVLAIAAFTLTMGIMEPHSWHIIAYSVIFGALGGCLLGMASLHEKMDKLISKADNMKAGTDGIVEKMEKIWDLLKGEDEKDPPY